MIGLLIALVIMAAAFTYAITASSSLTAARQAVASSYAAAAFSYHQAAIAYKLSAPGFTGTIPLGDQEAAVNGAATFASCADARTVMTRIVANILPASPAATAAALASVSAREPDIATVTAAGTLETIDGRTIATLPCPADAGETVLFTQVIP